MFDSCFKLFLAGVIVILFDELFAKGYGLGSGISFSSQPMYAKTLSGGIQPHHLQYCKVLNLKDQLWPSSTYSSLVLISYVAIREALFRSNLPNLAAWPTLMVFLAVIYFARFLELKFPVKSARVRGRQRNLPIKLFYTSNTPIMLQSALVSNVYFVSQFLYNLLPKNFLVRLLGCPGR